MVKAAAHTTRSETAWQLACLFIVILSGFIYLPAMSGLAIWDDHALIGGPGIGGGKSVSSCFTEPFLLHYFRPLVSISFFIDHKVFGSGPFFYHQTNLLIHVVTTLICLGLFRAAFRSRAVALAAAAAFALQPAQVSTVAWIGGRTDSLCTLWVGLFAWALIRSAQTGGARRAGWTALSTVSFGLALLTKEQVIGLAPLIPLAFRCFSPAPPRLAWQEGLRCWIPYLVTVASFVAAWCTFYPSPFRPTMHGIPEQAALAGRTMTYYTLLLALPSPNAMHLLSLGTLERWGIWSILPGYVMLFGLLALWARGVRRFPACAWFCAFVLAAILPVCNFVPLPSLVVAPYRAGVCGLGAAALLGCLFTYGYRKIRAVAHVSASKAACHEPAIRGHSGAHPADHPMTAQVGLKTPARLRLAAGVMCLLWCGALTWWGAGRWQDERTIFSTVVRYDPDSIVARFNLITAQLHEKRTRPALLEIDALMTHMFGTRDWMDREKTLAALKRDSGILDRIRENQGAAIEPETWLAALYTQMGIAQLSLNDLPAARKSLAIGRAIDRTNDDVNLGLAQMAYNAGDYHGAAGYLRIALAARPQRPESHMLLGHTLAAMGRWRAAREELETWALLQPWCGQAQVEVAQAKCHMGDYSGARMSLEYALSHSVCDVQEVHARLRDLHGRAAQFLN